MLKKFTKAAVWLLLVISGLFWVWIISRMIQFPENHLALNFLWINTIFIFQAVLAWLGFDNKLIKLSVITVSFIFVLATLALIQFNILLPYEWWLERKMPERPF